MVKGTASSRQSGAPSSTPPGGSGAASGSRPPFHEVCKAEILPHGFLGLLGGALDAKGGVLVGHHVILVLRVDGLVLRRDVDVVRGEPVFAKVVKEVGIAGAMHVDVGEAGVFVLDRGGTA